MNLPAGNTKTLSRALLGAFIAFLTAFVAAAPAFAWTDNPLTTSTRVRKVHIDELRAAIDAKVVSFGFAASAYADPTITAGVTLVRAVHVQQMQSSLWMIAANFRAWCPAVVPALPVWYTITAGSTLISASHFTQLRAYVDSIGNALSCCPACRYPAGGSGCAPCTASGVYFCADGCNLYYTDGCCGNTYYGDCCTMSSGGYCSGGVCY